MRNFMWDIMYFMYQNTAFYISFIWKAIGIGELNRTPDWYLKCKYIFLSRLSDT